MHVDGSYTANLHGLGMGEEINEKNCFPIHRSSILDSILSVLGGSLILLRTFGSEFLAFKKNQRTFQFGCLNFQNLRTSGLYFWKNLCIWAFEKFQKNGPSHERTGKELMN
jgi:hypothetical protein